MEGEVVRKACKIVIITVLSHKYSCRFIFLVDRSYCSLFGDSFFEDCCHNALDRPAAIDKRMSVVFCSFSSVPRKIELSTLSKLCYDIVAIWFSVFDEWSLLIFSHIIDFWLKH